MANTYSQPFPRSLVFIHLICLRCNEYSHPQVDLFSKRGRQNIIYHYIKNFIWLVSSLTPYGTFILWHFSRGICTFLHIFPNLGLGSKKQWLCFCETSNSTRLIYSKLGLNFKWNSKGLNGPKGGILELKR